MDNINDDDSMLHPHQVLSSRKVKKKSGVSKLAAKMQSYPRDESLLVCDNNESVKDVKEYGDHSKEKLDDSTITNDSSSNNLPPKLTLNGIEEVSQNNSILNITQGVSETIIHEPLTPVNGKQHIVESPEVKPKDHVPQITPNVSAISNKDYDEETLNEDTFSSESLHDEMNDAYYQVLVSGGHNNPVGLEEDSFNHAQTLLGTGNSRVTASSPNMTRRLHRLERKTTGQSLLSADTSKDYPRTHSSLSRQSSSSTSCLAAIPAKEARYKNFLVGSASGASGSTMGAAELDRILPERKVNILVVTWNMAEPKSNAYPEFLVDLLIPDAVETIPDIYAICLQEGPTDKRECLLRIQATLGPTHVLFEHASHGTLALCIFLRRELIWYTSIPEKASVSTRTAVRTKGGVGISFILFGSSFLFLSSHFKSDDGNIALRFEDYDKIVSNLDLPKIVFQRDIQKEVKDVTKRFDLVFWSGDLNFRIVKSREIVDRVINAISLGDSPNYEDLLTGDELLNARAEGKLFQEFDEGRINFPPTYKYDMNSGKYDTSQKNRIPSYTDRILFKSRRKGGIACLLYQSIQSITYSDHRPVYGFFEVEVKPGRDNVPLSAGTFYHDVYTEGNRRRALHLDLTALKKGRLESKLCAIQ